MNTLYIQCNIIDKKHVRQNKNKQKNSIGCIYLYGSIKALKTLFIIHTYKNDCIYKLVLRSFCVNSAFINLKSQSSFCSIASNKKIVISFKTFIYTSY